MTSQTDVKNHDLFFTIIFCLTKFIFSIKLFNFIGLLLYLLYSGIEEVNDLYQ
jgi:hypothetical protein